METDYNYLETLCVPSSHSKDEGTLLERSFALTGRYKMAREECSDYMKNKP